MVGQRTQLVEGEIEKDLRCMRLRELLCWRMIATLFNWSRCRRRVGKTRYVIGDNATKANLQKMSAQKKARLPVITYTFILMARRVVISFARQLHDANNKNSHWNETVIKTLTRVDGFGLAHKCCQPRKI